MIDMTDYADSAKAIRFFEEFSKIPHGSGNTSHIADWLVSFAEARGLEYKRDNADNVIIRKPAARGYESRPAIIFQGHLDMVAEKKPGADIDMEKEGLTLYRDGDLLRAENTTLGGDDGVALAYALAVLDSDDIPHPDFEAIFTSDEEIGLLGAAALDGNFVNGRLLINIDSDVEGIFTVGCAGGMRSDITLPITKENACGSSYTLKVSGFKGGHSGVEIDKGRINASKALAKMLEKLSEIKISDIHGGNADNAIPRECECTFSIDGDITAEAGAFADELKNKYKDIEPDITIELKPAKAEKCIGKEMSSVLIKMLNELPSGVIAMSEDIEGLVETSLNLGILKMTDTEVNISFSVRSAKGTKKRELGNKLKTIAAKYGAAYSERGDYPAWEYKKDSHLREVMKRVYENMYGKSPEIVTIHAGLECGILSEKMEGLDCVSIGPDNFDIHTTEERLSLPSFDRVWKFLKRVLAEI